MSNNASFLPVLGNYHSDAVIRIIQRMFTLSLQCFISFVRKIIGFQEFRLLLLSLVHM